MEPDDATFDALIEKSSLGTAGARQLRARTSRSDAAAVRQIIHLRNLMAHGSGEESAEAARALLQLLRDMGYAEQAKLVVAEAFPGGEAETIVNMAQAITADRQATHDDVEEAEPARHHPVGVGKASAPRDSPGASPDHDEMPVGPAAGSISFANLDATEFEEFCHDLLVESGFVNVDWRKGTPKQASPADRGRDLVAQLERVDVDGHRRLEAWFVDCKHYNRGVPPEAIQSLMTWSEAERPDVALVIASGYLSNPAKEWLDGYERNRQPTFRTRYWEKPTLARMLGKHPTLLHKHGIIVDSMRTTAEILAAEHEYFDKIWYVRKLILEEKIADGRHDPLDPKLKEQMKTAMRAVEERYGPENVGPWDDWGWGFVQGKLSALRWVLGEEWDFLDT